MKVKNVHKDFDITLNFLQICEDMAIVQVPNLLLKMHSSRRTIENQISMFQNKGFEFMVMYVAKRMFHLRV